MRFRIAISVFICLSFIQANCEDLKDTNWISINAQRRDGSKIVDRLGPKIGSIQYYFSKESVQTLLEGEVVSDQKFLVRGKILFIGEYISYQIDTLSKSKLTLTEIPKSRLRDDQVNTITFLNLDYYFNFLSESRMIEVSSDSIIKCNDIIYPSILKVNFKELVSQELAIFEQGLVFGSFVLSSDGSIKNIEVEADALLKAKKEKKLVDIISATIGFWRLPMSGKSFNYKVRFHCFISAYPSRTKLRFSELDPKIYTKEAQQYRARLSQAHNYFNRGSEFLIKEKFEKAVVEFNKCIEIDTLYLDAYYNKAYSLYKLNRNELACEQWLKLLEFSQKEGERLYKLNCK